MFRQQNRNDRNIDPEVKEELKLVMTVNIRARFGFHTILAFKIGPKSPFSSAANHFYSCDTQADVS